MAEKVNKTYTSFYYHSLKLGCILLVMLLGAENDGSVAVYDLITQYVIYFMGSTSTTCDTCFRAKREEKCMSEHSFCYIIIYL